MKEHEKQAEERAKELFPYSDDVEIDRVNWFGRNGFEKGYEYSNKIILKSIDEKDAQIAKLREALEEIEAHTYKHHQLRLWPIVSELCKKALNQLK